MNILFEKSKIPLYNKFGRLPLGSVTARGWLKEQLTRSKNGMGGHLDELEPQMIGTPHINNSYFDHLPDREETPDPTFASGWSGEISAHYWIGLVELAYTLRDDELIKKAERWVEAVLAHQEEDGFLGSFSPETDRLADYCLWSSMLCYKALLSFYEATDRSDVLDAVYRGCLWFCEHWKDHKTDYAAPASMEVFIVMYAYTGNKRLIDFCLAWQEWLSKNSCHQNKVSQYLSDALPYASMHAVAYGQSVKLPAVIYCATGEERLLRASQNGLKKAIQKTVHVTGGPSSSAEQLSPRGSANEVEYCNYTQWNHSYFWMAMADGESHWGDKIERSLFNGAQGARKKDERAIAYFSAPNQFFADRKSVLYGDEPDYGVYAPNFYVACCPANSVRTVPEFVRGMVMQDKNRDLYMLCYGPAEVRSDGMDLTVDTLYPFRDTVTFTVRRAGGAALFLRIPEWCAEPSVTVNGKETPLMRGASGFARIGAALAANDEIVLKLPMKVSVSRVDDGDASGKYPMVIERGPLVYSLPVETEWKAYSGRPITPLPEGWSWYEAVPGASLRTTALRKKNGWYKAIDEQIDPGCIRVTERASTGYVWEDPPVTLEVPLYPAPFTYMPCTHRSQEPWGARADVYEEARYCTLVPHGCTNLRVTYFPRAKL